MRRHGDGEQLRPSTTDHRDGENSVELLDGADVSPEGTDAARLPILASSKSVCPFLALMVAKTSGWGSFRDFSNAHLLSVVLCVPGPFAWSRLLSGEWDLLFSVHVWPGLCTP